MRSVYVISDLHLGGDYPVPREPGKRGFRLCTRSEVVTQFIDSLTQKLVQAEPSELVLNGDTVDFLAEHDEEPNIWSPFTSNPDLAVKKLETIVKRDQAVFDALKRFLDKGGRLVMLLGNHDIELSLPAVRSALRRALGVKGSHDFEFLYDGEAYVIGDALIEHGNRYDSWNQVDNDGLRRVRSFQSRLQDVPQKYNFVPPAGSEMVTGVINTIKLDYPFVDLLKPETSAVLPILLALEPCYRSRLAKLALLYKRTLRHGLANADTPKFGGDIRSEQDVRRIPGGDLAGGGGRAEDGFGGEISAGRSAIPSGRRSEAEAALREALRGSLGDEADEFLRELDAEIREVAPLDQLGGEISAGDTVNRVWGFARLLLGRGSRPYQKRLPALLRAMRGVQDADTFDLAKESLTEYLDAAQKLTDGGKFRYVVFGHTHQAKKVSLRGGGIYFNSGTWADVLRFPSQILKSDAEALAALDAFVAQMKSGDFSAWTLFRPTYVHLQLGDDGKVSKADLLTFSEVRTS